MIHLNDGILREVGALARSIQSINDTVLRRQKLQKGQFIFLTRICENPGINLIDLSNMLKVDKTTTTKVVQKMMEEDYVHREKDTADQRMWHLFPSEKAMDTYPLVIKQENHCIDICFANLNPDEKIQVNRLLGKMRENIEAEWKAIKKG